METPLVSICSITYNHAPFIRQCLDGFLMQQCNFPIEIIINDDCSTDGTTEIIREYAERYPDKIFPVFHTENQWSKGEHGIFQKFVFPKARGKYIALCEGDDYWTDPLKLQKQVDFLESHPDYSMCFHKAGVIVEDNREYRNPFKGLEEREYTAEEVMRDWIIPTASMVYRREVLQYAFTHKYFRSGDVVIHAACLMVGRVYCIGNVMSAYRLHAGGWSASTDSCNYYTAIMHQATMLKLFPNDVIGCLKMAVASLLIGYVKDYALSSPIMTIRVFCYSFSDCWREVIMLVNKYTKVPMFKYITSLFIKK